ncbi:bifunctional diguanylate cyclase/phosphodiesterase [Xylophilus sp. Leaf220]|uniref:putative bifunctional diguanylate cyclase/phosphodiesterase n=1 Tax=Xylophilus sp. Leaf220 TaxID=1735686 RepID=UPI0007005A38|nr:EAL domain-containing protein [Xylophilus sp. Leaf220]KQM79674.1 hypothetical protein ASE76_00205 [Xylophilus sp. Leaf220]
MAAGGRFLPGLARRIFWGVLAVTAAAVMALGALFYGLGEHMARSSTRLVLAESTKLVNFNLLDRLRAAEQLLQTWTPGRDSEALDLVFSSVAADAAPGIAAVGRLEVAIGDPAQISLVAIGEGGRSAVRGVVRSDYLWENVQSGLYDLCMRAASGAVLWCAPSADLEKAGSGTYRRELLFRPFLEADPWVLVAVPSPQMQRLLPVGVGLVVGGASLLAVLVALMASSVFLRRITQPLGALTRAAQSAGPGALVRVDLGGMQDEMRELGLSFNRMMDGLAHGFGYQALLSRIDAAILERQPFEQMAEMVLGYCQEQFPGGRLSMVSGSGTHVDTTVAPSSSVETLVLDERHLLLWEAVHGGPMPAEVRELAQRLHIALEAQARDRALAERATTDVLTGLWNRLGLLDELARRLRPDAHARGLVLAYCDLDHFKEVNDAYGHTVGDALLVEIARRMKAVLTPYCAPLARLGGDEFAALLPVGGGEAAMAALCDAVRLPVLVGERELHVRLSIGGASAARDASTAEELLRMADLAMYQAKAGGGDGYVAYSPSLDHANTERLALLRELRLALETDALFVVYQPRVDAVSHRWVSAEALLRWRHPSLGLVPPDRFIPLAEEAGLIESFGAWVLEQACAQWQVWHRVGSPIRQISVNVSPLQLASSRFYEMAADTMRRHALPPGAIELEITEGLLVQDRTGAAARLQELRQGGYHIALDDFGVGYSSLSYLADIPFDTLKVDRSFVMHIHEDAPSLAIVTAIVAVAQALGKHVVAEGIELDEQAKRLAALGVHELQGYLFGRPMPVADIAERTESTNTGR